MTMAYVRSYYGVPAKRGMRITAEGKPGEIRGAPRSVPTGAARRRHKAQHLAPDMEDPVYP